MSPSQHRVIFTQHDLLVDETLAVGVAIGNRWIDRAGIVRQVDWLSGLPAHVHLVHEGILTSTDQVRDRATDFGVMPGWPPRSGFGDAYVVHPVDGFHPAPGVHATIALGLLADAPGTYLIGPITVRADVPGLFGLPVPFSTTRVAETIDLCVVMCVQVGDAMCRRAAADAAALADAPQPSAMVAGTAAHRS